MRSLRLRRKKVSLQSHKNSHRGEETGEEQGLNYEFGPLLFDSLYRGETPSYGNETSDGNVA
jgi:hypothetical protein